MALGCTRVARCGPFMSCYCVPHVHAYAPTLQSAWCRGGPGFNLKANAFTSLHFDSTHGAPLLVSEIGFYPGIVYTYIRSTYLLAVGQRPLNKSSLEQTAGDGVSRHASQSEQPFAARHQPMVAASSSHIPCIPSGAGS